MWSNGQWQVDIACRHLAHLHLWYGARHKEAASTVACTLVGCRIQVPGLLPIESGGFLLCLPSPGVVVGVKPLTAVGRIVAGHYKVVER